MNERTWERIEVARRRWDVLRHPFYQRWSNGELTAEELARYSGQYRHAVEAIATMSAAAAEALPERPSSAATRPRSSVTCASGTGSSRQTGGDAGAEPTSETAECVRVWTRDDDAAELLARLFAVESSQPEISRTKLEGLLGRYGVERGRRHGVLQRPRGPRRRARRRGPRADRGARRGRLRRRRRRRRRVGVPRELAPSRRRLGGAPVRPAARHRPRDRPRDRDRRRLRLRVQRRDGRRAGDRHRRRPARSDLEGSARRC